MIRLAGLAETNPDSFTASIAALPLRIRASPYGIAAMTYDVAILGGGPGGYTAALRAAQRGARVCLIEQGPLGGACLNVGCIPTKALLHLSQLAFDAGHAAQLGLSIIGANIDGGAIYDRITDVVTNLRTGLTRLFDARNIDVVVGHGRVTDPNTIHYKTDGTVQPVHARSLILATGSRPIRPGFVPWQARTIMTTDRATTSDRIPPSVLIVGGGPVGCEFATIYAEMGVHTVLVEQRDRLLPELEPDAGKAVERSLRQRGVHLRTTTTVDSMMADDEAVTTDLSVDQRVITHAALIAVGREANVDDIGLETVGVELVGGLIAVDDHCRTNVDSIYAVGDVACRKQYAHVAARMGAVAADNATGHDAADDLSVVPECIYTHPEIARIGLSAEKAHEQFDDVKVADFPLLASGMAQAFGQTLGASRLIARESTGEILGAVLISPRATELIGQVSLAMRKGLTVADLAETIHAHPSFSETLHEAAASWLDLPIHTLR
jgi:dihydrolipoamide dehydrogenase